VLRWLICWAIVPLVVLSIPERKHHHYMLAALPAWAALAAFALPMLRDAVFRGWPAGKTFAVGLGAFGIPAATALMVFHRQLPSPIWFDALLAVMIIGLTLWYCLGVHFRRPGHVFAPVVVGLAVGLSYGSAALTADPEDDVSFVQRARAIAVDAPLFIDANTRTLDFFRIQIYSPPTARLIHNLTFLRDETIRDPVVYVIARAQDEAFLRTLGQVQIMEQSRRTRREIGPHVRFTLYRLTFDPATARYPAPRPESITVMQGLFRAPQGPFVGPAYMPPNPEGNTPSGNPEID
jgi:hypothetical protein